MREDEDIRHYMPVLRRFIILVAVITAIPVAMWTITAMVRTYVGPPKLPTFRPIAAAPAVAGPDQAAAAPTADEAGKGARQPLVEANATSSDTATGSTTDSAANNGNTAKAAGAPPPAAPGTFQTANLQPGNSPANSGTGTGGAVTQFAPEERQAATNWPNPPGTNWPNPAAQQPAAAPPAADAQPIAGPVPLPRKRPHTFTIAQSQGIPLPRPRPDAAGPASIEQQQPTPANWLRNIFGSPGQQPAAAPGPAEDEYRPEPH